MAGFILGPLSAGLTRPVSLSEKNLCAFTASENGLDVKVSQPLNLSLRSGLPSGRRLVVSGRKAQRCFCYRSTEVMMSVAPAPSVASPQTSGYNYEEILLEPYTYINRVKGKGIRSQLVDAFDAWLNVPEHVSGVIKQIVEDLHQASLLVDDIEDNSKLRRGLPVAHHVYGIPATLNCANFIYFVALDNCQKLGNAEAVSVCIEEMLNLHRGQAMDMFWRDSGVCPTEDEYIRMVILKTGGLFKLAVRMMQAFSTTKDNLMPLVEKLGVYFQTLDDYLNLASPVYAEKKSFCEDLTEGKFSFPVIHSIRSSPCNDTRLLNIVKQKTEDIELKKYAVSIMEETGSFQYTRSRLEEYKQELFDELHRLGGNELLVKTIQLLSSQMETNILHKS